MTERHLDALGVAAGWTCLEVGAGGGSIARLLAERIGTTGSVLATDVDTSDLADMPATVTVGRLDVADDDPPSRRFDLVHCRAVLMHVPDPVAAFSRLASAVAPGGWLLVEEGDFGLFELTGPSGADAVTTTWHEMWSDPRAARIADAYLGRRVPGMVDALGWDRPGAACDTSTARRGDPAYEALRLAVPEYEAAGLRLGVDEASLNGLGLVFHDPSTLMLTMSVVSAWARRTG